MIEFPYTYLPPTFCYAWNQFIVKVGIQSNWYIMFPYQVLRVLKPAMYFVFISWKIRLLRYFCAKINMNSDAFSHPSYRQRPSWGGLTSRENYFPSTRTSSYLDSHYTNFQGSLIYLTFNFFVNILGLLLLTYKIYSNKP